MSQPQFIQTIHLSDYAILSVKGPDSERFLQGQQTCDAVKLADQHWQTGACCTAKGRMVANFIIARSGSDYLLRLPIAQAEALQQHLSRYAVFYKTTMAIESDLQVIGKIPAEASQATLEGQHPLLQTDSSYVLSWPDGREECWSAAETADATDDVSAWAALDIEEGIVWVTAASREAWVPQFVDMTAQGGISFHKGCYTGQEIVARLQYLGKTKKHLVKASSDVPLTAEITGHITDGNGKNIGEIAAWQQDKGLIIIQGELPTHAQIGENTVQLSELFYTEEMSAEESAQSNE